jgi:5-methylcytosine-specific restriction endonuclease McrA
MTMGTEGAAVIGHQIVHDPRQATQQFFESWGRATIGMTLEERGVYAQICATIVGTRRSLPDGRAAAVLSLDVRKWRRIRESLMRHGAIRIHQDDGSIVVPALKGHVHRTGYAHILKQIPAALRWEVFRRDGYKCLECGSRTDLTADHIDADILGGETTIDNLQTLCRPCNSKKGAR